MIDEMLRAVARCAKHPEERLAEWIRPYRTPSAAPGPHQFLVMLKPELTSATRAPDGRKLLAWVLAVLADHGVRPGAARVLSGAHVAYERVVESHYAMLNAISRHGLPSVSAAATERLLEHFPQAAEVPDRVLGGHQFLSRFPEFTPRTLDVLVQNLPVAKAGAGTYAVQPVLDGKPWVLLNAFHPFQAAHFTAPGSALVLMECTSEQPLRDIRARAVGATDPRHAEPGTIRRSLLDGRPQWSGRWDVSTSLNAIHVSPSDVEAMFAVQRFFGSEGRRLSLDDTLLGRRLLAAGADRKRLQALEHDPEVEVSGLRGPLFEITEDMDTVAVQHLLLRLLDDGPAPGAARPQSGHEGNRDGRR
ncbi:hypothetical protein ACFU98_35520 [Streptomyces sp. NPDC057575]|uniref:hypothetical protein n=1 Tax=unclassified Streptomyces TaxID=2593676 RepID=UPI0036B2BF05